MAKCAFSTGVPRSARQYNAALLHDNFRPIYKLLMAKPDGCWQQPTGISPRPMLMGAPRNALRAFNAGVSLSETEIIAVCVATRRCRLAKSLPRQETTHQSQKTLLGEDEQRNDCAFTLVWKYRMCSLLRQDHGAPSTGLCSVSFVIRLPVKFSRYIIATLPDMRRYSAANQPGKAHIK